MTLPTRTGPFTGHVNERQMLAKVDVNGFQKAYRTNLDGSTTRLETKGGMPRFITNTVDTEQETQQFYLESGQLEFSGTGELDPLRLKPAKWHFLDIVPDSERYLGYIEQATGTWDQANSPSLAEGKDSLAIGYPQSSNPAVTAVNELAYEGATVQKKVVTSFFPPSIYSGKMRLFIQALLGAQEKLTAGPLFPEIVGTSVVLYYRQGERSIQLGTYAHNSVGILTASDGTFWVIQVLNPTGYEYVFTAYGLTLDEGVDTLVDSWLNDGLSTDEKRRVEAYIFANSTINLTKQYLVGSFASVPGSAMAYGWKFNSDGSKASIITHQFLGTDTADNRWSARTIHVTLSTSKDPTTGARLFALDQTTTAHGEWTDGWGVFNLFVPESDPPGSGSLALYSQAVNATGVMPEFAFTNVHIYGYYKDDVWVPITVSRTVLTGPFPINEQSETGIAYDPLQDMTITFRHQFGYVYADQPCTYELHQVYSGNTMSVSVGGTVYDGYSKFGNHSYFTRAVSGSATAYVNTGLSLPFAVGTPYASSLIVAPPGYPTGVVTLTNTSFDLRTITLTMRTLIGATFEAWALVIPCGDCEAAYVATNKYETATGSHTLQTRTSSGAVRFFGATDDPGGMVFSYHPLAQADAIPLDWFGGPSSSTAIVDTDGTLATQVTKVYCYNTELSGALGTPGGSYEPLFTVPYYAPRYARGMYTYTSAGGRYVMSEGLLSPASVNYLHRFVGWA